jgi:ribosomal peptide maturation radical SAM protein 1
MKAGLFQLVVTPFLPSRQPALGISSLAAVLKTNGYPAAVRYLNVDFALSIGWDFSSFVENCFSADLLIGEMIFARALWGEAAPSWQAYREHLTLTWKARFHADDMALTDEDIDKIGHLYDASPQFIRRWAGELIEQKPRVIGFTSSFQQNVASLALARQIRMQVPREETLIIYGGANSESEMGRAIAENFPFVDHVVSGEGERTILDIAHRAYGELAGEDPLPRFIRGAAISDLDRLPFPDFHDYFRSIAGTPWEAKANLVAESSRGCWWGEKSHCTFCGLNGTSMGYRAKSADRLVIELSELRRRYGRDRFMLSDNIMNLQYLKTLLPTLIEEGSRFKLFYETKANLKKDQLELLAAAGVNHIQPGIESFSSEILRLMAKGTSRLQNIQLLKWCKEFQMGVVWGILYGFPREPVDEYSALAELIPSIVHLPPPKGTWPVRLDRFSPYWQSPDQYGLCNVRQSKGYDFVYAPLPPEQRKRLAYFFDYDHADGRRPWDYFAKAAQEVEKWRRAPYPATLELTWDTDPPSIWDTRGSGGSRIFRLRDEEHALLRIIDARTSIAAAWCRLKADRGHVTEGEFAAMLDRFRTHKWIAEEDGVVLSLVVNRRERARVFERVASVRLGQFEFVVSGGNDAAPASV